MKVLNNYLISFLFLLFSFNIIAQGFELIKVESTYFPKQPIEGSPLDGKIDIWEWNGQLAIPQVLNSKKTILIHNLAYSNVRADIESNSVLLDSELTKFYHTISYRLDYVQTLSPKWILTLNLKPLLASDFEEALSGDDFLFQGTALAIKSQNEQFSYGFGFAYTTRFGRPLTIPGGMLKYTTSKMNFELWFPDNMLLMYNTHKPFQYGIKAEIDGGLFNNSNNLLSSVNSIIDQTGYSRINIGPAIIMKLKSGININLLGGIAIARRLEFIDIDENIFDSTPETGPFFRFGLSYSPKIENEERPSEN